MGKKRRILVAALVAAFGLALVALVAVLVFFRPEPEPIYRGKPLSAWLEGMYQSSRAPFAPTHDEIEDAVRHIGTNALPTLLRMMRARDSALTLKLVGLAGKQNLIKIQYSTASTRIRRAWQAFGFLGAEAKDAVPALINIYEENISEESRMYTVASLGKIGPAAEAAVPLLLRVATDTNYPSEFVGSPRYAAFDAIGEIHARPELAVPVLVDELRDPEPKFRPSAFNALVRFEHNAKQAVPKLFELLRSENSSVRHYAVLAIQRLDPETAALRKGELEAAER